MSRPAAKTDRKKQEAVRRRAAQRENDRGVYATIIMVGVFGLFLWFIASHETFPHAVVGYVVAVLGMINVFAWKACRGSDLSMWQRSLAKIPLRFAGYGTKGGKPLTAAHDQQDAMMMFYLSLAVSVVLILVLSFLLIPELRGG